jgi:hypothetical protein
VCDVRLGLGEIFYPKRDLATGWRLDSNVQMARHFSVELHLSSQLIFGQNQLYLHSNQQ